MRILIACMLIALVGCTHIPIKEYQMPDPPADLMEAPDSLKPLQTNPDGSINSPNALAGIVENNTIALNNSVKLLKLQNWILKTQKNIQSGGK